MSIDHSLRGLALRGLLVSAILGLMSGCPDPVVVTAPNDPIAQAPAPSDPNVDAGALGEVAEEDRRPQYVDSDFVEADALNRDPFRSFVANFQFQPMREERARIPAIMGDVSIDQMRLVGLISGPSQAARAMLVDPEGVGHIVRVRSYLGRAEIIQAGADSMPVTLHWRVRAIRSGELVLEREDPSNPDGASLIRVIPLYAEGESPEEFRRRAQEALEQQTAEGVATL